MAVLAELVDASLPLLEILSSGRRPFLVANSAAELRDRLGARCGLARRVVARELSGLESHGFVRLGKLRNRRMRLEVQPTAFGWPEDDFERRRAARERRLERRYAPVPLALVGPYTPAETATLVRILASAGVGLFERIGAGERIVVHVSEQYLAAEIRVSPRTVRRALDRLEAGGMVTRTSLGRDGIAIELRPALLGAVPEGADDGQTSGTFPTGDSPNQDISDPALMHARSAFSEREENSSEAAARGVDRVRYGAIYGALIGIVAISQITTDALRARARRAALVLAMAGADADQVAAVGAAVVRETGSLPLERVADRLLDDLRRAAARETTESQFRGPDKARPQCSLCDGLSHIVADGVAVGCPHDLERVRDWATARGWSIVSSPSGKTVLEIVVEVALPDEPTVQPIEELVSRSESDVATREDERRAVNAAGVRQLLDVLARRRAHRE